MNRFEIADVVLSFKKQLDGGYFTTDFTSWKFIETCSSNRPFVILSSMNFSDFEMRREALSLFTVYFWMSFVFTSFATASKVSGKTVGNFVVVKAEECNV